MLSYEEQRQQNIRENEELLKSLGLTAARAAMPKATAPKPKPKKAPTAKERRQRDEVDYDDEPAPEPRRGTRTRRPVDRSRDWAADSYTGRGDDSGSSDGEYAPTAHYRKQSQGQRRYVADPQRLQQRLGERIHDPKTFGSIPGVEVGSWWASRMECSTAAIHAPVVAGISGNAQAGAWSVALSGGYPDDVDLGEAFTYTGSGGRDLKGTKNNPKNLRTAPQTFNQSFDNPMNAALKKSAETGRPVRVVRGFKLDSVYAPAEGYRYDGLYVVEKAWMAKGLTKGLLVCRYAFRRMPDQPPLPVREEESDGEEDGNEVEAEEEPARPVRVKRRRAEAHDGSEYEDAGEGDGSEEEESGSVQEESGSEEEESGSEGEEDGAEEEVGGEEIDGEESTALTSSAGDDEVMQSEGESEIEPDEEPDEEPEEEPAQTRRSRSKKAPATSTIEQPKRGRGRPKKVPAAGPEQQKRRPGRPRKVPAVEIASEPPKRAPGRPRKSAAAETIAEPPKRGPGRPKKTPAAAVDDAKAPEADPTPVEAPTNRRSSRRISGVQPEEETPELNSSRRASKRVSGIQPEAEPEELTTRRMSKRVSGVQPEEAEPTARRASRRVSGLQPDVEKEEPVPRRASRRISVPEPESATSTTPKSLATAKPTSRPATPVDSPLRLARTTSRRRSQPPTPGSVKRRRMIMEVVIPTPSPVRSQL